MWQLAVQEHQRIRVTFFDFELDVKRNGVCVDFLQITGQDDASDRERTGKRDDDVMLQDGADHAQVSKTYFKDCGAQGRQMIDIDSTRALVTFHTDLSSLTERGFLIYFEGTRLRGSIFLLIMSFVLLFDGW